MRRLVLFVKIKFGQKNLVGMTGEVETGPGTVLKI